MTHGEGMAKTVPVDGEESVGGDEGRIARLYSELAPELRRFILGVVRDPELTEDVMQATFVKAIEQGHQARHETARGWLFQVAFREALASRRRLAATDRGRRRLAEILPGPNASPEAGAFQAETVEAVRKALNRLPDEQRQVISARIYEDKTFAQIAGEMGLPLGTVLTRMRRGLDKMRSTLRPGD